MCMILSANYCAVTLSEYLTIAEAQLMCMPFVSTEHTRCLAKQMVERPSKTSEEEEKCVASAIPR